MPYSVDLNCDMGEGMANDALLMPLISSANIACGYHAGDQALMEQTIALALQYQVKIGAHPAYPDRENFGRTNLHFPPDEVRDMVKDQIQTLTGLAKQQQAKLYHVKPHGALYNTAWKDEALAEAICAAILETDPSLVLYAQSGSVLAQIAASRQISTCQEVFADRSYQLDGSLTPRSFPNALLEKDEAVVAQALQLVMQQSVWAEGQLIRLKAETLCLHGDGPHALEFAQRIRQAFQLNHIRIR